MNTTATPVFETLNVSMQTGMARIELNRPHKANAINSAMRRELREAMDWLDATPQARVSILSAAGAHFSAGLDLACSTSSRLRLSTPATAARAKRRAATSSTFRTRSRPSSGAASP